MDFDVQEWWANKTPSLLEIARENVEAAARTEKTRALLYNPYEGCKYARQLNENVEDFVKRLPPATTQSSDDCPWVNTLDPKCLRNT